MLSIRELPRILRFLPKIILAVIVTACDEVYKKIAYWLNDMGAWWRGGAPGRCGRVGVLGPPPRQTALLLFAENYRLQSAYEKHLIIKMVLVRGGRGGHGGDRGCLSTHPPLPPSSPRSFSL